MNIMYIHGFGSKFTPTNDKVVSLGKLGTVMGPNIDYTDDPTTIYENLMDYASQNEIDLIVGTSMGGFFSHRVGVALGIPFAMINPAIQPWETLKRHVGEGITFLGEPYALAPETVREYDTLPKDEGGFGLVLLDEDDEVIDPVLTQFKLGHVYPTIVFAGGNHRFEHIEESLEHIKALVDRFDDYITTIS